MTAEAAQWSSHRSGGGRAVDTTTQPSVEEDAELRGSLGHGPREDWGVGVEEEGE